MVLRFFQGSGEDLIKHAQGTLMEMLADDRHSFDIATSALLDGAAPAVVGPDLARTDHRVNEAQRTIRRELVVHISVRGTSQVTAVLTYMSVVKDVERIGDYAKNIYDVAALGADLSGAPDREELVGFRDRISVMITEAARAFADEDLDESSALIAEGDAMQDRFDAKVSELVTSEEPGREAVPRVLLFRYYKRIVGHLMNLLSAVVMPVDRLDYYDEEKPHRD
jgi:phosphate uptake regulator